MLELLDLVKLPRDFAERMPRQLSGGQKQRVGIARAFAGNAKVVVADEPVSALDVSVQAAVTELLMDIQRENRTTLLFISHDLSVVRYLADRVVVMYLGHIVEQGTTDEVFSPPYHPYTEALLSAVPIADTSVRKKHIVLEGDIPSAMNPPSGCPFQTRCPHKPQVPDNLCEEVLPPMRDMGNGHRLLCHLPKISWLAWSRSSASRQRRRNRGREAPGKRRYIPASNRHEVVTNSSPGKARSGQALPFSCRRNRAAAPDSPFPSAGSWHCRDACEWRPGFRAHAGCRSGRAP